MTTYDLGKAADELYSRLFRTGAHRSDPVPADPKAIIRETLADAHNTIETFMTAFDGIEPTKASKDSAALIEALSWAIAEIEGRTLYANPDQQAASLARAKDTLGEPSSILPEKPPERPEGDYFAWLVWQARIAAAEAMKKFPQPNYVTLKIAEEAGEVVRAGVHYAENRMEWSEVEGEIIQLLAMLLRFVVEGDRVNGIIPPSATDARSTARAFDNTDLSFVYDGDRVASPPYERPVTIDKLRQRGIPGHLSAFVDFMVDERLNSSPVTIDELRRRGMDDRMREVVELMVGDHPNSPPGTVTPAEAWALGYGQPCPCGERGLGPDENREGELCDMCAEAEHTATPQAENGGDNA